MKKLITTVTLVSILVALAGKAIAQWDLHYPMGVYRGMPYLSNWSQRWLTNQSGSSAAAFWLGDTNAALSFWNFMQPFAYAQNTNALNPQQQSAIDSVLGGYWMRGWDARQNYIQNASYLSAQSFDVSIPSTVSVTNCPFELPVPFSLNGAYNYIAQQNVGQTTLSIYSQFSQAVGGYGNVVSVTLPAGWPAIPGLPNSTNAAIFSAAVPLTAFPAGSGYYVAYDQSTTNFSLYQYIQVYNGTFQIQVIYSTEPLPANYIYGVNQSWTATQTPLFYLTGTAPLYDFSYDTAGDLVVSPIVSITSNAGSPIENNNTVSSSNMILSSMSLNVGGKVTATSFVGNGSGLTGITAAQVIGAVPSTDSAYGSIWQTGTTATNANNTASIAWTIASNNAVAIAWETNRLNFGTNNVAAANTTAYTWKQPSFFLDQPFANPDGRRATLYANIIYTNSVSLTFSNSSTGILWTFTNNVPGVRAETFQIPMSPIDAAEIFTNVTVVGTPGNVSLQRSWILEQ